VYLASIRGLSQQTDVHRLASEALRRLVIDEANVGLHLNLHAFWQFRDLWDCQYCDM
jgi:hypothetical protein